MYIHCNTVGTNPSKEAQYADRMVIGITPSGSGHLHHGHQTTTYNFMRTLACSSAAEGLLHIDDREFYLQKDPVLPSEELVSATEERIDVMIRDIADYLHEPTLRNRIRVVRLSDLFREQVKDSLCFDSRLLEILDQNRQCISDAFSSMKLHGSGGMRPFCPDCSQAFIREPRRNKILNGPRIEGQCHNQECSTERFEIDVATGDTRWAIFYGLVSLLSIPLSQQCGNGTVMIFQGGDYGIPWGPSSKRFAGKSLPKAERLSHATACITGIEDRIMHFVGPLLHENGRKLSKSDGDRSENIDCETIERWLQSGDTEIDIAKQY